MCKLLCKNLSSFFHFTSFNLKPVTVVHCSFKINKFRASTKYNLVKNKIKDDPVWKCLHNCQSCLDIIAIPECLKSIWFTNIKLETMLIKLMLNYSHNQFPNKKLNINWLLLLTKYPWGHLCKRSEFKITPWKEPYSITDII